MTHDNSSPPEMPTSASKRRGRPPKQPAKPRVTQKSFRDVAAELSHSARTLGQRFRDAKDGLREEVGKMPNLSPTELRVALKMIDGLNRQTGVYFSSDERLAGYLERHPDTVRDARKGLLRIGFLLSDRVERGGHHPAFRYTLPWLVPHCVKVAALEGAENHAEGANNPDRGGCENRTGRVKSPPIPKDEEEEEGEKARELEDQIEERCVDDATAKYLTPDVRDLIAQIVGQPNADRTVQAVKVVLTDALCERDRRDVRAAFNELLMGSAEKPPRSFGAWFSKAFPDRINSCERRRLAHEATLERDRQTAPAELAAALAEIAARESADRRFHEELRPEAFRKATEGNRGTSKQSTGQVRGRHVTGSDGRKLFQEEHSETLAPGIKLYGITLNNVLAEFPELSASDLEHHLVTVAGDLERRMSKTDKEGRRTDFPSAASAVVHLRHLLWGQRWEGLYADHGRPAAQASAAYSQPGYAIDHATFESWAQTYPVVFSSEAPSKLTDGSYAFHTSSTLRRAADAASQHAVANFTRYGATLQGEIEQIFTDALMAREGELAQQERAQAEQTRRENEALEERKRQEEVRRAERDRLEEEERARAAKESEAQTIAFMTTVLSDREASGMTDWPIDFGPPPGHPWCAVSEPVLDQLNLRSRFQCPAGLTPTQWWDALLQAQQAEPEILRTLDRNWEIERLRFSPAANDAGRPTSWRRQR